MGSFCTMVFRKFLIRHSLLLQLLVTSITIATEDEAWKHVPEIPAGRRTQYLLFKNDGSYKFGYDTGDSLAAKQSGSPSNEVSGSYGYVDANGVQQTVQYSSGVHGYVTDLGGSAKGSSSTNHFVSSYGSENSGFSDAAHANHNTGTNQHGHQKNNAHNVFVSYKYNVPSGRRNLVHNDGSNIGFSNKVNSPQEHGFSVEDNSWQKSEVPTYQDTITPAFSNSKGTLPNDFHQATETPNYTGEEDEESSGFGDASYSFNYSTDDHSRSESSDAHGNIQGTYSYVAPTGTEQKVDYEAGAHTGFVIKKVSSQPVDSLSKPVGSGSTSDVSLPSSSGNSGHSDASYAFSYNAGDHSRTETSDANGNIQGSYSFTTKDDGVQRKVDYSAGSATGFVATGSVLPGVVSPEAHSGTFENTNDFDVREGYIPASSPAQTLPSSPASNHGSYSFSYDAGDHSRSETGDVSGNVRGTYSFVANNDGVNRKVDYSAGPETGFIAIGDHLPESPKQHTHLGETSPTTPNPSDYLSHQSPQQFVPYSFNYNAGDHSRSESSDSLGNVKGSFSFVAKDDGVSRNIDYSAGSETGFIATGAHLPVPPQQITPPERFPAFTKTSVESPNITPPLSTGPDGSYSFSYNVGDHSRSESGDSLGNVKGSFSFVPKDDGVSRNIEYSAGSSTGFVAVGKHLPTPPQLPNVALHNLNSPIIPTFTQTKTSQNAPSYPSSGQTITRTSVNPPSIPSSANEPDRAYSFSYDAGDHARTEVVDSHGNVQGSYSFVAGHDGQSSKVHYSSGSRNGVISTGGNVPVGHSTTRSDIPIKGTFGHTPNLHQGTQNEEHGDVSYSYSYETDSSSKQETSDPAGNVQGSYSFIGGDGVSRTVQYTSKQDEGFIAAGDHLPKQGSFDNSVEQEQQTLPLPKGLEFGKEIPSSLGGNTYGLKSHVNNHKGHQTYQQNDVSAEDKGYSLRSYLPPNSEKFGYIFDTKRN